MWGRGAAVDRRASRIRELTPSPPHIQGQWAAFQLQSFLIKSTILYSEASWGGDVREGAAF